MSAPAPIFRVGQTVFHVADEDPGVVIAVIQHEHHVTYRCVWSGRCTDEHAACELSQVRVFSGVSGREEDDEDEREDKKKGGRE
jgi:hypothetical protein